MPVTQVGVVYYADDPDKKVFRVVAPTNDDSELDRPDPEFGEWTVFGVDPARVAVMDKVPIGEGQITGGVNDPPTINGLLIGIDGQPIVPPAIDDEVV